MPEQAVCATQAPPWQTSGTVLLRHRRAFSSQPHLKFRSLRQSGVSPEQATAVAHAPLALHACVLDVLAQRRSPAPEGSHSLHLPLVQRGVVPEQVLVV